MTKLKKSKAVTPGKGGASGQSAPVSAAVDAGIEAASIALQQK